MFKHMGVDYRRLIQCAGNLAHRDLLGDVKSIRLGYRGNVEDLSTVPTPHLASLVSTATSVVYIRGVTGCNLVPILDGIKCQKLFIYKQKLGRDETQALVRAMETRVEIVRLDYVDIDIEALTKYSGQGRCFLQSIQRRTKVKFIGELVRWIDEEQIAKIYSKSLNMK